MTARFSPPVPPTSAVGNWLFEHYGRARGPLQRRRDERQWELIDDVLADGPMMEAFRTGAALPEGYGRGWTERVVEYPWTMARLRGENVLDAGATFNHAHIVPAFAAKKLTIVTLAPEREHHPDKGISYLFGDLRELPFKDGTFDATLSISTLEHVGMDNTVYGADKGARDGVVDNARADAARALRELVRVTRPGGQLLLSVPYGIHMDLGWQRQFDAADLEELLAALPPGASVSTTVYDRSGDDVWKRSSLEDAKDAVMPLPGWGANAVACVAVELEA